MSLRFVCKMVWQNLNELFGRPNITFGENEKLHGKFLHLFEHLALFCITLEGFIFLDVTTMTHPCLASGLKTVLSSGESRDFGSLPPGVCVLVLLSHFLALGVTLHFLEALSFKVSRR